MDRVADFESVGWGFESLVPRQNSRNPLAGFFEFFDNTKRMHHLSPDNMHTFCVSF